MTTDSDFQFKLEQLQDQSVLQALRGVCERVVRELVPGNTCEELRGKERKRKLRAGLPSEGPLVNPFRSLLERASRVVDERQRRSIVGYLGGVIGEHVRILDVVLGDGRGYGGMVLLDAIFEAQGEEGVAVSVQRLLRLIRRGTGMVDGEFCGLAMARATAALEQVAGSAALILDCPWAPWALALAALPCIDSRYRDTKTPAEEEERERERERVVLGVVVATCDAMVKTPEVLVESVSGKVGGTASVETVLALAEVTMQIVLGKRSRVAQGKGGDETETEEDRSMLAGLLTVRWELEWVARALGVCTEFRSFFAWDSSIRNRLLQMLVEDGDQSSEMAAEFGLAVGLRCTPPQMLVALELLRASKASRDASDVVFACSVGKIVRAGMAGLTMPKEVVSAERNQEFASLGQRIQVLISRNFNLDRMLSKLGAAHVKVEEEEVADEARDEDVDELLSIIGVGAGSSDAPKPGMSTRTPRSAKRKIQPERVGNVDVKVERGDGDEKEGGNAATTGATRTGTGSIHHNGRVIMPPTFDLDAESRELLWMEYLKDKDKLVEMLGDSNYRKWHDESQRPELRRQSGVDKAFDAVFGAGTAINDNEHMITDETGAFIETPEKKALELCCTVPWDALLVGALAVATDMVRRVGDEPNEHARLLEAVVDSYEVDHYVQETLSSLPEEGRAVMECCAGEFTSSAGLGGLICVTGTMKKILLHTARHTRAEVLAQFLELMQVAETRCFKDLQTRQRLRRPALLACTNLRACMTFPPLMGNSISSKSSKLIPELCALARDTEAVVYTSACCWTVWHSLKSKRVPADWIPEGVDLSTHPLCAARVQQRCHFITSSLRLISSMVQEIDEGDALGGDGVEGSSPGDIIAALVSSSSLCATIAVDLRKGLTLYRSRTKSTKSAFQIVCEQTQVHLNVFSVASGLCEIYCGLADDWDEFISLMGTNANESAESSHGDSIPHAGAVVFGYDFTEALQSYLGVLSEDGGAVLRSAISPAVMSSVRAAITETETRLRRVLKQIQAMDKKSQVYILSAQQIRLAPAIVVLDTVTHYTTAKDARALDSHDTINQKERKRKTIKDVENPYLRAALMEEGPELGDDDVLDDDLSDLEDFIVTNPDVDYVEFLHDHFPHGQSEDDE